MFLTRRFTFAIGSTCLMSALVAPLAMAGDEALLAAKQDRGLAPLFLTMTNGSNNYLAVINTQTKAAEYVPTGGLGGASGNAGGVAAEGSLAAAVNFNSSDVTIFVRRGNAMEPTQKIKTASKPLSVAFGHSHLLVLEQTAAESFPVYGDKVTATADGMVQLARGDGSAAQIVSYDGGAAYTEKSGGIGLLSVSTNGFGGVSGPSRAVLLPNAPNNDTPFGLVGRGANLYVTIAHSNLETLVVNGQIVSMAASQTPYKDANGGFLHAPCWNALHGQFLYSTDSPGKQILRYLVSDTNVFFDRAAVAKTTGSGTDLGVLDDMLGVIDGGDGTVSNATLFDIGTEGDLTMRFTVKIAGPINGAAIIR